MCGASNGSLAARQATARRARSAALAAASALLRRCAYGTLLPGRCRAEEEAHQKHVLRCVNRAAAAAAGRPDGAAAKPDSAALRANAAAAGHDALMEGACAALALLCAPPLFAQPPPGEEGAAAAAAAAATLRAVVVAALDAIPAVSARGAPVFESSAERNLAAFVAAVVAPRRGAAALIDPAFYSAVMAKWASPAVAEALRSRGGGAAAAAASREGGGGDGGEPGEQRGPAAEARPAAGAAAAGAPAAAAAAATRACGLPSCGKAEAFARQFRVCGGCGAVAYCGEEHAAAAWKAGHRRECRAAAAPKAAPAKQQSPAEDAGSLD